MLKINLQQFGGRGGGTSAKSSALFKIENKIKNASVEHAALINEKGEVLFEKSDGKVDAVHFTQEECAMMQDATLTHNHPGGTTFSDPDLVILTKRGLREIRAVHADGVYSLTRNYNIGDAVPSSYLSFAKDYKDAFNSYKYGVVDKIFAKTQDADKCNQLCADYRKWWLKTYSNDYGYTYKEG